MGAEATHEDQDGDDYQAAKERLAELAGCLEDTPEEHELVTLELTVAVWETKKHIR